MPKGKMVGERLEAGTQLTVGPDSPYPGIWAYDHYAG